MLLDASPSTALHAAVLGLAGLLTRPVVPLDGPQVHAHGAPASVAVKPHHHSSHHSAASTSTSSSSGGGDDDRSKGGEGGSSDDFEGLNFAQVSSTSKKTPRCHSY